MNALPESLFIGSATYDLLMPVSGAVARDTRLAVSGCLRTCGGIAATSAAAFAKLGGAAGLITAVAEDENGRFVQKELQMQPFSFLQIIKPEQGETPFSTILTQPDGARLIAHYGGCLSHITLSMLDRTALEAAPLIHLGGLPEPLFCELAHWLRANTKARISVDGGNLSRACTDALLPNCDIFIPDSKTAYRTLGLPPAEACRYYRAHGASIACVTRGAEGAVMLYEDTLYEAESFPAPVVDTTGAGDNFHGAFLYALQKAYAPQDILSFACAFSALSCTALGGTAAQPTLAQTLAKMKER